MYRLKLASQMMIPGVIEELKRVANVNGNLAWHGIATGLQSSRNTLYVSGALAAAAIYLSSPVIGAAAIAVGGFGANRMHQFVKFFPKEDKDNKD